MARITKPAEKSHTPADLREVSEYIAEIGRLQREIERSKNKLNEDMENLRKEALERDLPLKKRIDALTEAVERFTDAKWTELFASHHRKSIKLTSGIFGKRISGPWVKVHDQKTAVAELKKRKLLDLIKAVETVRKDRIRSKPELAAGIKSIAIRPKEETFFILPSEVKAVEEESR